MTIGARCASFFAFVLLAHWAAAIEYSVVDADGRPVAGAEVTFFDSIEGQPIVVTSDEAGNAAIPAGIRTLGAVTARGPGDAFAGRIVTYGGRSTTRDPLRLELGEPQRLEVTVIDANLEPVADADLVLQSRFTVVARTRTDSAGRATVLVTPETPLSFLLAQAPQGTDYVSFRREGAPAGNPYQLTQDHEGEVTLCLAPSRPVTVRVVDPAGEPVVGAELSPWLLTLPKHGEQANLGRLWNAQSDESGNATFDSIPIGIERPITIWVGKSGYKRLRYSYDPSEGAQQRVATLQPLVSVSGVVLAADGTPAADVAVKATGAGFGMDDFRGGARTGADGSFTLNIDPNQYYAFSASTEGYASRFATRVVLSESPEPIELRLEEATRVVAQLVDDVSGEPVTGHGVQLYRKTDTAYNELPTLEQRLPNPDDSRRYVQPILVQYVKSDDSGRIEFSTGSGAHYFIASNSVEGSVSFDVAPGQPEHAETIRIKPKLTGVVRGRVVFADEPERGAANVTVRESTYSSRSLASDSDGRFELKQTDRDRVVGAFNEDLSMGAVVEIEPLATEVTLPLAPTAFITGVLIDPDGNPEAEQEVIVAVRVDHADGTFSSFLRRSETTGADGRFTLRGLAVGRGYELTMVSDRDNAGRARGWTNLRSIDVTEPGERDLGEVTYKIYREPTIEDYLPRVFADDPGERLEQRTVDAAGALQQVLLVIGSPEAESVRSLVGAPYYVGSWRPENDLRWAMRDYMMMGVRPGATGLMEELGIDPPTDPEGVVLAIVDANRRLVAASDRDELSTDGAFDPARVAEFLREHRAALPDAVDALDAALAEAAQSDRRVYALVSGAGCAPCVRLVRHLKKHSELVERDYVFVKLDDRMPRGQEAIGRVQDEFQGVPYSSILDKEGKRLGSYLGFPSSDVDWGEFRSLLEETGKRLTSAELDALIERRDP